MAQYFRQVRFYNEADNDYYNSPAGLTIADLVSGTAFNAYYPIVQLGIQAPPGTEFNINGSERPAIMGYTGLFELELNNGGEVINLNFSENSLKAINANPNFSLIIDMIYER